MPSTPLRHRNPGLNPKLNPPSRSTTSESRRISSVVYIAEPILPFRTGVMGSASRITSLSVVTIAASIATITDDNTGDTMPTEAEGAVDTRRSRLGFIATR
jgi:hypothetical protein